MKKILLSFLILSLFSISAYSQRILLSENFETAGLNTDSLPTGWLAFDEDQTGLPGRESWECRDSGVTWPAGSNELYRTLAYNSARSLTIGWVAGDPVADDWVFTTSLDIQTGDSLIFYMILGSPILPEDVPPYIDTMQVHVSLAPLPNLSNTKLATIRSLDSNNIWTEYKFDLSAFAGQQVYIAFRYFMNTTENGLLCYIDNVFVGNHSAIGIQPIGTNVPKVFALRQNYPNPFNPMTNIEFDLPKSEFVRLIVFNTLGQEVKTLVNETKQAGSYRVDFDASNLPSGAYFYRIIAGDFVQTNKMILVK